MTTEPFRVLFTSYALVHFVCFKPIYDRLVGRDDVQVLLSGGLRSKNSDGTGYTYDLDGLYGRFGVVPDTLVPVEALAELDVDVLVCANTKRIEPRSARYTVEMFHGLSFRNRSVRPSATGMPDHYWVLGPYMRRLLHETGLAPSGDPRAVEIGFPKTDPLLDGSLSREAILGEYGFTGDRPVVLYAPTGAKGNSMKTMGKKLVKRLRAADAYDVLVKPHDHAHGSADWFERLAPLEDEHTRLVRDPDVVPSLYVADLLISDASSVSNEYSLLDRPMVFLDVPDLILMELERGTRVDLQTWGRKAGPLARDPKAAVAAVADELAHPDRSSPVRRRLADDMYYNPGSATDAAMAWLDQLRQALVPTHG